MHPTPVHLQATFEGCHLDQIGVVDLQGPDLECLENLDGSIPCDNEHVTGLLELNLGAPSASQRSDRKIELDPVESHDVESFENPAQLFLFVQSDCQNLTCGFGTKSGKEIVRIDFRVECERFSFWQSNKLIVRKHRNGKGPSLFESGQIVQPCDLWFLTFSLRLVFPKETFSELPHKRYPASHFRGI